MARTRTAFEPVTESFDGNMRAKSAGIHFARFGREKIIHSKFFKLLSISFEPPRILLQIFARAKLMGIHENRCDHRRAFLLGRAYQRKMPLMQRAHRRNKSQDVLFGARVACNLFHPLNCSNDFHRKREAKLARATNRRTYSRPSDYAHADARAARSR